jgi:hypothetical protein
MVRKTPAARRPAQNLSCLKANTARERQRALILGFKNAPQGRFLRQSRTKPAFRQAHLNQFQGMRLAGKPFGNPPRGMMPLGTLTGKNVR